MVGCFSRSFARRCDSFLLHDDHERPEQVPVHVPNKSMRPLPHAGGTIPLECQAFILFI